MQLALLPLAIASAVDPALIAAVALMLSRQGAVRLLLAYFVGGLGVSLIGGLLILFALGAAGLGQGSAGSESPGVDIGVGVLLLAVAILAASGVGARQLKDLKARQEARSPGRPRARHGLGRARSVLDRVRSGDSPWVAWLAGVAWGVPGAFYLAALALIARSGEADAGKVGVTLLFNLIMFALVEVPLVAVLIAPDATRSWVRRLSDWMGANRRPLVALIAAALATYLVAKGVSRL